MDVERLKRAADDPRTRDKILAKINSTFLYDSALFPLKYEVKQMILSFKRSGSAPNGGSQLAVRMEALSHVQQAALHSLRSYWLKKYIDSMAIQNTPCHIRRMSESCAAVEGSSKSRYLPKIITVHDALKDSRQPRTAPHLFTSSQQSLPPVRSCGGLIATVSAAEDIDKVGATKINVLVSFPN